MAKENKLKDFEFLFKKLKKNYGKLLLINLIFSIPLGASIGIAYLINMLVHMDLLIYPLALVFSAPFYPGVVVLSRDISEGTFKGEYLKRYLEVSKENWHKFLLSGVFLYIAFEICYLGIYMYMGMAAKYGWVFYIPMAFSVLIMLFFLFLFYGVFLMIPSFELKIRSVYKNSALSTFGELKGNFMATLCIIIYLLVLCLPFIVISYLASVLPAPVVIAMLTAYVILAVVFLLPAPCSMIISHYRYKDMLRIIAGVKQESEETTEERADKVKEEVKEELADGNEDIEKLLNGNDDDYVFYKGKMIKRGLLRKLHEQTKGESIDE